MGTLHVALTLRHVLTRLRCVVIVATVLGLVPSHVRAQAVGLGAIIGTVSDTSGGALPGVTVKLTSPALQVPESVTVSDGEVDTGSPSCASESTALKPCWTASRRQFEPAWTSPRISSRAWTWSWSSGASMKR